MLLCLEQYFIGSGATVSQCNDAILVSSSSRKYHKKKLWLNKTGKCSYSVSEILGNTVLQNLSLLLTSYSFHSTNIGRYHHYLSINSLSYYSLPVLITNHRKIPSPLTDNLRKKSVTKSWCLMDTGPTPQPLKVKSWVSSPTAVSAGAGVRPDYTSAPGEHYLYLYMGWN